MRINDVCVSLNNCVGANNNQRYAPRYSDGLKQDTFTHSTPSFTSLKKAFFKGIDFAVVEKFKSPIEKFRSMEDFEAWAEEEYFNICMKDFGGRTGAVRNKRESMICDWDQALSSGKYSNAEKLLVIKGITKELKPNDETICPVYNRNILEKTMNELKTGLEQDKKLQFDFGKMYRKNLIDMYSERSSVGKNESKWIVIPSKDNDPEHFKENVEKLQTISSDEMCTKFSGASFHLGNGDMHIYLENGKPKVILRLNDGVVQEVNSDHNNFIIEKKYVGLTEKYLDENDLVTTEKADEILFKSKCAKDSEQENKMPSTQKHEGIVGFFKSLFCTKK